ncbi:MAG: DnaD domain protein [Clostridia bacterium]|nr:DnaD domain protein [Clostridia bacterium]
MNFSINPQIMFGLSFNVPAAVADKHLKLAGAAQLKVLLWLLRHAAEGPASEDISKALNIQHADVCDAMQYWVEAGIVLADGKAAEPEEMPSYAKAENINTNISDIPAALPAVRPTSEQINRRAKEDPEIKFMLNMAQEKLGRTIGYDSQGTLLMICDTYGLPVAVLLMLIEYCVSIGKSSINYIEKAARTWSEKEIDSIEKADEQIQILRRCEGLWKQLCAMTGISTPRPTSSQSAHLRQWSTEWGFDIEMIYLAYEEMANHTDRISFPYMNKVLANWHENKIKTPQQLEEYIAEKKVAKQTPKKKNVKGYEASYDIDEFNRRSMEEPLIYKPQEN